MRTWQLYGKYRRMIGELAQMPMPKVIWERQLRELMGAFETEVAPLEPRNVIALRSELCGQLEYDAICTTNTYMREVRIAAVKLLELQGWAHQS